MASCKPCGRLPTAPPPMPDTSCPPNQCSPCALPVIAEHLPKYQVTPCDPNPANVLQQPCCSVCVPLNVPKDPPPPRSRKCKYIQPPRPKSYAPQRKYIAPELKMADDTIYRKSYIPVGIDKPDPIMPTINICVGEGKMSDDTVNRMSYQPLKAKPACPIYPCEHKLIGEGPMQDITTNKHDYVPKPWNKTEAIRPFTNLYTSDCPLSDKTVNRLSYMPVVQPKVGPILPTNAIEKPTGKISDRTINKLSYQPWQPQVPMDMPWKERPMFVPPKLRMEDNTVNKMSYQPPGEYVECDPNDPDCIECPEAPCEVPKNCGGPSCCMPCCCPKAAC